MVTNIATQSPMVMSTSLTQRSPSSSAEPATPGCLHVE